MESGIVKNRRRNYFIDKKFQAEFIVKFWALIIAASLLTGILVYYLNRQTQTVAFQNLKVVVKSTADFIFPVLFVTSVIVTLIIGIIAIAITLFTSHRIAGPLYRLKVELEKMERGDISSVVRIRTTDQLQAVAADVERMRANLRSSVDIMKANWPLLKEELRKVYAQINDSAVSRRIEESVEKLDRELAKFKTR